MTMRMGKTEEGMTMNGTTKNGMKGNGGANWVFGLFVTALLLLPLTWLGGRWASKEHSQLVGQRNMQAWEQRRELWLRHQDALEAELRQMGPFPFKMSEEAAVMPVVEVPAELAGVVQRRAEAALTDLEQAFPGRQQGVRLRLMFQPQRFAGTWSAFSEGVPPGAVQDPDAFRMYGGNHGDPLEIVFELGDYDEYGTGMLSTLFQREDMLMRVNVAGNTYPVGVRGYLDMEFLTRDEGPMVTGWQTLATVFDRLGLLGLILLVLSPPLWVFVDARRRRLPAVLWGLFAVPTNVLGALIYALVNREAGPTCPECGERVSARYVICPYCRSELKGTCPHCGQTVAAEWNYCPSCSKEL